MKTYCLALDLKDDPALIAEYRRWHERSVIWPEVVEQICGGGVLREMIFLLGTRMVMVLTTTDDFCFETKRARDRESSVMQRWEALMDKFQQTLTLSIAGEKWVRMENIFDVQSEPSDAGDEVR